MGERTIVEAEATDIEPNTRFQTTSLDEDTFYGYVEADLGEIDRSFVELFEIPDVVIPPMVYTGENVFSMTVLGPEAALQNLLSDVSSAFD